MRINEKGSLKFCLHSCPIIDEQTKLANHRANRPGKITFTIIEKTATEHIRVNGNINKILKSGCRCIKD